MMGELSYRIADEYLTLLKEYVLPATALVVCTVAPPAIVAVAGFSTGGIVAGSLAAGLQSSIGNVAAGSAFAILQSAGTAPLVTAGIGAATGAGGLAVAYGAAYGTAAVSAAAGAFSVIKAVAFASI
jgi:hypothetical protein